MNDPTSSIDKIASVLRTDKKLLLATEERLAKVTGERGVFLKIIAENQVLVRDRMLHLGISESASTKEVYDALISKIEADDYQIYQALGNPDCRKVSHCQKMAEVAKKTVSPPKGFFLKLAKAEEFVKKEPPRQVMDFLGYDSVDKMLAEEDLLEVYSALRFIEGSEWLNTVFFKQYEHLTPDDFEEREVVVKALSEKWGEESKKFVAKKKHNISHLKELGVVFIIPTLLGISGEILRTFMLIMHYLHEIPFYSDMFRRIAKDKQTFSKNFISLLRGDVLEKHPPEDDTSAWLVIQRYLAKDDSHDWRLFAPHINPEASHWRNAEEDLPKLGGILNGFSGELIFWKDLDWVGEYFRDESGVEVLVSFNLVDTVMSLVKQKEMVKYLYHHQEALWNKIFSEYFGMEKLEEFSKEYLLKGYFEI